MCHFRKDPYSPTEEISAVRRGRGEKIVSDIGREITAGQRTMSGQNAELSAQILTLPVILTGHFR